VHEQIVAVVPEDDSAGSGDANAPSARAMTAITKAVIGANTRNRIEPCRMGGSVREAFTDVLASTPMSGTWCDRSWPHRLSERQP
jgi:hypothetical protein